MNFIPPPGHAAKSRAAIRPASMERDAIGTIANQGVQAAAIVNALLAIEEAIRDHTKVVKEYQDHRWDMP